MKYQIIYFALRNTDVAHFENKLHIHERHGLHFNGALYTTSNLLPKRKNVLFDVEKYLQLFDVFCKKFVALFCKTVAN